MMYGCWLGLKPRPSKMDKESLPLGSSTTASLELGLRDFAGGSSEGEAGDLRVLGEAVLDGLDSCERDRGVRGGVL